MTPGGDCPPMMQAVPTASAMRATANEALATRGEALGASPCNRGVFWSAESNIVISFMLPDDQAQRPPPETPGRLQESLTNYLNRPSAQRGGGALQRPC